LLAEALVDAVAEGKMAARIAGDVELARVGVTPGMWQTFLHCN